MKKLKCIKVFILCLVMLVSLIPISALAEGETCSCGSSYDEYGVCPSCGDVRERSCETVYCEKGKLTVYGKVPENVTPAIAPVYVSADHSQEWSGIADVSDLCYRMYDLSLADNAGEAYITENQMLTKLNPEFVGKPTSVRIFRIYEIELIDENGKPYKKTVGEEIPGAEWDGERVTFSFTMPERWLIVGTPDGWGLLAMRLARLNGLTASSNDAERLLLAVDEASQNLRNTGVSNEEIFNHDGLDWSQYNQLRSSLLVNKTLTSGNVTVSGLMPASAWLEVSNVSKSDLGGYIEGRELVFAYDITVKYGNGREYQPGDVHPLKVLISNAGASCDTVVTHIEDANTAENIASSVNADGSVVFKAESFSVYIGTTVPPKVDNYSIATEFGTWDTTLLCGDTPKVVITVTNPGKFKVKLNSVTVDSEHFVATGFPAGDEEPADKKWSGYLEASHALTANRFSPKITVKFQYSEDGTNWSDEVSQTFDAPSFIINHNLWGGWCRYAGCDCRDGGFSGKFTGGDKRTYFRNNSPTFATNLLYYQYDANKDAVLQHGFTVLIDGKEIPQWGYEIYQIEDNYTGVCLKNDYLISLRTGRHTIHLTETDRNPANYQHTHFAFSWFRISSAVDTGDKDMMRVCIIMICGLAGSVAGCLELRKRSKGTR